MLAKFGTLLGIAPGDVPAFCSDYATVDPQELPDRQAFQSYVDGVYMGYKWQCVEFARRWLYLNKGYVFDDVAMAYEIFRLRSVSVVRDGSRLPLRAFRNGSRRHPEPHCLLVWDAGGEFEHTGHVAIVTEVTSEYVRVAEQNVDQRAWPEGQRYSRQIAARITPDGAYWLECSFGDARILGWLIQTEEQTYAEGNADADPRLFALPLRELPDRGRARLPWLDLANPSEAAYFAMIKGHKLTSNDADQHKYLCLSDTAHRELRHATNELHGLFMRATEHVLQDDALLARFNIPRPLWPRLRQSWSTREQTPTTGRFDLALSERGIKVYEYNCDSAACYLECATLQGKWAAHFGCRDGRDAGGALRAALRMAWSRSGVGGALHILRDRDPEEAYHALFMREVLQDAGIRSKVICGFDALRWAADGRVVDGDGEPIRCVWKTWAWETALAQLRAAPAAEQRRLVEGAPGARGGESPRLVDVLLHPDVRVHEPLWTAIPSNKAILPVLWALFPEHPYLLDASFELTDTLRRTGYVQKPIGGRSGHNIAIFDEGSALLLQTAGQFQSQDQIFQQLWVLPTAGGYHAQVSTFTARGHFAGAGVRVDPSLVIDVRSDNLPLRVVDDEELLPDPRSADGAG